MIYDVKNISFTYPSGTDEVFGDISFTLEAGEILCVLGPNDAGKSTLMSCMAGLLKPSRGSILLEGSEMFSLSRRDIARTVGYVPQSHTPVFGYTVFHFIMMGRTPHIGVFSRPGPEDEAAATQALGALSIEHLADRVYTELSGGERQQAVIAQALAQRPKVLLFDEPAAHLDYGNQQNILSLIKKLAAAGFGVIITTHNPDHALLLGGITAVMDGEGNFECGATQEILTEARLKQVYKTDLRLLFVEELGRTACLPSGIGN